MKCQRELSIIGAYGGYSKTPAKHAPVVGNSVLNLLINILGSGSGIHHPEFINITKSASGATWKESTWLLANELQPDFRKLVGLRRLEREYLSMVDRLSR